MVVIHYEKDDAHQCSTTDKATHQHRIKAVDQSEAKVEPENKIHSAKEHSGSQLTMQSTQNENLPCLMCFTDGFQVVFSPGIRPIALQM